MTRKQDLEKEGQEIGKFIKLTLKVILWVSFILFALTLGLGIQRAVAPPSHYIHTFTRDLTNINQNNVSNGYWYNLGNPYSYIAGNYSATYSYESQTGLSYPPDSIDFHDGGNMANVDVIASYDGHNEVVEMSASVGWQYTVNTTVPDVPSGSVEWWWQCDDQTGFYRFIFYEGGTRAVRFRFDNTDIITYDSGDNDVGDFVQNTWYHIRVDFDCSSDTYDLYIDGVLIDDDRAFENPITDIDRVFTDHKFTVDKSYLDAWGFSWMGYTPYSNMIPDFSYNTSRYEPLRDEFNFEGYNNLYDFGDSNFNGWTDISGFTYLMEYGQPSYKPTWDRIIRSNGIDWSLGGSGLEQDFNANGDYIDVQFSINTTHREGAGYSNITIRSIDESDVVIIILDYDGSIKYLDSSYTEIDLNGFLKLNQYYNFSISLNYIHDVCFIEVYNGTLQSFGFPLRISSKTGLGTITYLSVQDGVGTAHITYLDYFGVFADGISLASDYGFIAPEMELTNTFDLNIQYFYNITEAFGNFSIYACETNGVIYEPQDDTSTGLDNTQEIRAKQTYNNFSIWQNTCSLSTSLNTSETVVNFSVVLFFDSEQREIFNITNLRLDGGHVDMDGTIAYLNAWYSNTIYKNESYFYVDDSNRLNWQITFSNDSYEGLRVFIDCPDFLTTNRTIQFNGYQDYGQNGGTRFGMNYVGDEQDNWLILPQAQEYHYLLRSTTTITYYYVAILGSYDYLNITGYITSIRFNYLPTYSDLTITTLSLISVIIPLIIILVPSIGFGQGIKKTGFSKEGFSLMFFFLSLICAITSIIPAWLFFIILIAFILFLIYEIRGRSIGGI